MNSILLLIQLYCILLVYINASHEKGIEDNDKIITLEYQLFLNALSVFIKIGSDHGVQIFTLDTESPYSIISEYLFSGLSGTSQELGDITYTFPNGKMKAQLIEEHIIIEDTEWFEVIEEVPGFHFGLVPSKQEIELEDSSVLAFAFNINDKNYSLVHLYKKNDIINRSQFGIYRDKDIVFGNTTHKGGIVYIGGFPSKITQSLYENSIYVLRKKTFWYIPLQYIFIGEISYIYTNKYYEIRNDAYISTAKEDIIAPKEFYKKYIIDYYFKDALEKNICILKNHSDYAITCQCESVELFESVSFVINGKNYLIESKYLFKQFESFCMFKISQNLDENANYWILGVYFVWQYQTLFDYDGKRIVLYSEKEIKYVDLDMIFPGKKIAKTILMIFAITIVIILSCILVRYIKRRKMRKMNKVMKIVYKKLNEPDH